LISFTFREQAASSLLPLYQTTISLDGVNMGYVWYDFYKAVIVETDWTKMQDRIQSAESKINDRKLVLSEDHGGTREERQAIANALNAIATLRTEVADWQSRHPQATDEETTSEIALGPELRD
jgi:hypothetical protein